MVSAVPASPYRDVSQPPAGSLWSTVLAGRFREGACNALAPARSKVARCMVSHARPRRLRVCHCWGRCTLCCRPPLWLVHQRDALKRSKTWEAVRRSLVTDG